MVSAATLEAQRRRRVAGWEMCILGYARIRSTDSWGFVVSGGLDEMEREHRPSFYARRFTGFAARGWLHVASSSSPVSPNLTVSRYLTVSCCLEKGKENAKSAWLHISLDQDVTERRKLAPFE